MIYNMAASKIEEEEKQKKFKEILEEAAKIQHADK